MLGKTNEELLRKSSTRRFKQRDWAEHSESEKDNFICNGTLMETLNSLK